MKFPAWMNRPPWLFNLISWGLTGLIVAGLLGFTYLRVYARQAGPLVPEAPTEQAGLPPLPTRPDDEEAPAIVRHVRLKTAIDGTVSYKVGTYTVQSGDSVFSIATANDIKPETLLWANYETLQDSPDSIRIGQVLNIPPTDGVYYQWQEGDSLEAIAAEFEASVDDILNWPGNNIDLSNPVIVAGTFVMVPGGEREFVDWVIPTVARGSSGTASVAGSACTGGLYGSGGFIWPTANNYLSGNDFWSGHLGIDIAAGQGAPIWAADSGVVTMRSEGWNYGYGNVVMIDHGNGYVTLYAHLSYISVVLCQSVAQGQVIGASGNTGNSFGAHLHFEVREGGGFINPRYVLP